MAQKPLTVARHEFGQALANLINEAGKELPAFVMAEVLKALTAQMEQLAMQEYQMQEQAYKKALDEEAKATDKNK